MSKRLAKIFALLILCFSSFPLFSQIYEVKNPDALSKQMEILNCYWEFFPSTFINPNLKITSDEYNLGVFAGYDDLVNKKSSGSITDFSTFIDEDSFVDVENLDKNDQKQEVNSILVDVPSSWNDYRLGAPFSNGAGSGSYRLLVKGLNPQKTYGFHVYDLYSNAFSIYINGENIITVGSPNVDYTQTVPDLSMDLVYFKPNAEGEANFVLHISNNVHRNGGAWNAIKFAERDFIDTKYRTQLNYGFLCLGALFTIFLYQMLLFIFRKLDFGSLYLALFSIVILIRLIVTPVSLLEYFFPNISYVMALKLEYVALIFGPMLFLMYMIRKMTKILHRPVVYASCIFGTIIGIIVFASNAYVANRFVPIIQTYSVLTCLYIFMMIVLSYLRKPTLETGLMVFTAIFTALGLVHDIAAITNVYIILPSTNLISYAFITFVFIQAVIIARQQERAYKSVTRLSKSLQSANERYSRFVPKGILSLLNKKSLVDIKPGEWISKKVTLLCFDIKHFSAQTESCTPQTILTLLNIILGEISPIVRKYGGFIEKYLGDGIIAIFPNNGKLAFDCALEIQETIKVLQPRLEKEKMPKISGGIGIHYGKVVLGTVGNSERLNQISVSKDIETVMKLESITRVCNFNIIASRSAYEHWVPANCYNIKPLKEEVAFQAGIKELAFAIINKI